MPSSCCVPFCDNRCGGHKFPNEVGVKKQWIVAIRRDKWYPTPASRVCYRHFSEEDYFTTTVIGKTIERKILKPGAVPSQFSWTQPLSPSVKARMKRAQKKERSGNVSQKLILCHSKDDFDVGAEFEVGATVLMDDCGKTSETALAL